MDQIMHGNGDPDKGRETGWESAPETGWRGAQEEQRQSEPEWREQQTERRRLEPDWRGQQTEWRGAQAEQRNGQPTPPEWGRPEGGYGPDSQNGTGGWQGQQGYGSQWYPVIQEEAVKKNSMALASMVVGIMAIVTSCCFFPGMILGGLAVLFAALSRVEDRLASQARIGLITGIVGIALGTCLLIIGVLLRL